MSSTSTLSAMPQFNVQQPPTSVSVDQTPNNSIWFSTKLKLTAL